MSLLDDLLFGFDAALEWPVDADDEVHSIDAPGDPRQPGDALAG